jgi:phenylalanyl-tRNA synthetase beta chain
LIDIYPTKHSQKSVTVFVDHVNALLGLSLSKQKIKKFIEQTGSVVMEEYGGVFNVTPPWERVDLTIEANFIDEVGRIHGFSDVKSVVPNPVPLLELNARQYYSDKIRALLILKGFSEVITSSFRKKGNIQLQNSLASDKSCLREDLIKNISQVLDMNCVHKDLLGIPDIRVFEIGTVFSLTEDGIGEHTALSLGVRTKGDGYHPKDDVLLKTACEEIEKIVGNKLQWKIERGVAELDLSLAISGLSVPSNYESLPVKPTITYKPVSPYPAISRDIALWVNETELVDTVAKTLLEVAGDMCVRQTLFDTFTKEGRNSYAFRLVFQAKDRTLTDLEVNAIMEIVYKMASKHGWEVR